MPCLLIFAVSGSFAWKAARHELGDNKKTTAGGGEDDSARGITQSFLIDSFYPSSNHCGLEIVVRPPRKSNVPSAAPKSHPECITVSGVPCAATLTHGISMVVVDEESGCILQSKAFSRWSSTGVFLDEVPDGRIVALCFIRGEQQEMGTNNGNGGDDSTTNNFRRLGGFDLDLPTNSNERFFLFAGQLNFHPNWAIGICTSDSDQLIKVSLQIKTSLQLKTRLRSEMNVVPAVVSTRLPETVMPLKTQLAASNYQKRAAFNAYVESDVHQSSIIGYTTRHDAPIYLIDSKSFPFRRAGLQTHNAGAKIDASWVTYHLLPDPLVPDDDEADESKTASNTGDATPRFDIPVANEYFTGLLGNQLLVKNSTMTPSLVDTTAALSNSRIVALYFGAQWCGPCRGFTPLLIEFYKYLQEVAPTHGLKIVFVSSDQDENQFQAYYGKMPFLSLPFSNRSLAQHAKSVFGVRGIPSLVIIDSLSGTIVTSPDESRRDVHQACQRGEEAIERLFRDWLDKVPLETKSMLDILALSCEEAQTSSVTGDGGGAAKNSAKSEDYLIRKKDQGAKSKVVPSTEDFAAIVKEIFSQLVATGMEPNRAAAKAIEQATSKQKVPSRFTKLEVGTISGTSEIKTESDDTVLYQLNDEDMNKVLTVARKYVTNVQKDPSNPRFRNFRLSNKVFDQITSTRGGIELLTNLGFAIYHSDDDFVASIPLAVDLSAMCHVFDNLLKTIVNRT
jgi:thiol-disulfide isomerase/thioredoxin